MSYQVLARRWRPLTFEAVVGQGPIVRTLQNALARQRIAHAYLFTGPRGVGKTTTARLLAMGLNCAEAGTAAARVPCATCPPCREIIAGRALDVIEIDGASNRGIDEVRTLRDNARYAPASGRRKVYIIDEVHMLTEPAFNALLKTLEEPPAHVAFILATTEARRIPATILSRCQRFDFRPIGAREIVAGLATILAAEAPAPDAAEVEADALQLIARAADGSLRDALSLLDAALAYGEGRVTVAVVRELLGSGGAEAGWGLAEAVARRDAPEALDRIERAAGEGLDLAVLCQDAMEILRRALLARVVTGALPDATPEETARLQALPIGGTEDSLVLVKGLLDAEAEMRRSPHPRVDLEVALVRLCHRPEPQAIETVLARLEQAEARLRGAGPGPAGSGPTTPAQTELLAPPAEGARSAPAAPPPPVAPPPERALGSRPTGPTPTAPPVLAAAPPLPAGAPGGSLAARVEDDWVRIAAEVTRVRPILGHLLADGVVVNEAAGRVTVALPNGNSFTQDQVRHAGNRQLIQETAERIRPGVRELVFTTTAATGGPGAGAAAHPAVQAAVELFDGEVVQVRPLGPAERRDRGAPAATWPGSGEGA